MIDSEKVDYESPFECSADRLAWGGAMHFINISQNQAQCSNAGPFLDAECKLRIVFIAPDFYRVQERRSMGWKINVGFGNVREDNEMTPMYTLWCDEVRGAFGELDTFALDVLVTKD
jgi:hypothetical protein